MLIIKLVTEVANQYVNIHIVEYQTAKQSFTISALYPSVGGNRAHMLCLL